MRFSELSTGFLLPRSGTALPDKCLAISLFLILLYNPTRSSCGPLTDRWLYTQFDTLSIRGQGI